MWNYQVIRDAVGFYKAGAWNAPSGSAFLLSRYGWALVVLAAALLTSRMVKPSVGSSGSSPNGENLACWAGFCAIPVAGFLLAKAVSGMISPRYVAMYSLGFGLLLAHLIAKSTAGYRWPGYAAAGVATMAFLAIAILQLRDADDKRVEVQSNCSGFEEILGTPPYRESRLLIGDWTLAMQMSFYCPALQHRIVFPADPQRSLKYLHNDTAHKGLLHLRGSFPLDVEPLDAFVHQEQHEFLVFHAAMSFLKQYFTEEKEFSGRLHLLKEERAFALYAVDPAPTIEVR